MASQATAVQCITVVFLLLFAVVHASAQTGLVIPVPVQQFFDSTGDPLASGKLCSYVAGTTTPQDVYSDATLLTALPNPVLLNSAGRPQTGSGSVTAIYLQQRSYKFVLKTAGSDTTCATGTDVWTADDVRATTNLTVTTTSVSTTLTLNNDLVLASGSSTISLPTAVGVAGKSFTIKNTGTGTITIDPSGTETIDGQATWLISGATGSVQIVSDNSNWRIVGRSGARNWTQQGMPYTARVDDDIIVATSLSGTLSLYTAVGNRGRTITIKNESSAAGTIIIDPNSSETINGATTFGLPYGAEVTIWSDGGNWHLSESPVYVLDRDVAAATITNDNTEQTVYSYTLPANTLGTTRKLRLVLEGTFTNNTGGNSTPTLKVNWGGSTIATFAPTLSTSATAREWTVAFDIAAENATNAQRARVTSQVSTPIANGTAGTKDSDQVVRSHALTTDDTATIAIAITIQHDAASANLTFVAQSVYLELLP